MKIVTGAAGFIGSCLVAFLNEQGFHNLILVDDFSKQEKLRNLENKNFQLKIERQNLQEWLKNNCEKITEVYHLGALTNTIEKDWKLFQTLNIDYSQMLWHFCTEKQIPFLYASSAATYGNGSLGFEDSHSVVEHLQPLNFYGKSKHEFDKWVLKQKDKPKSWFGLKFFNVYGPNEYHKGRMASVVFHTFNKVKATNKMQLFASNDANFKDGEQVRDFIYVKDVVQTCFQLIKHKCNSGIYNLGTSIPRTFNDLTRLTFEAMNLKPNIEYIKMPSDLEKIYQNFTKAEMEKLENLNLKELKFSTLEEGIFDYVQNYLLKNKCY